MPEWSPSQEMLEANEAPTRAVRAVKDRYAEAKRRRGRRVGFIWILLVVIAGGNLWDLIGGHSWGPAQLTDQAVWVHASAALFWLAAGMFVLCIRDLGSIIVHRTRPPTLDDVDAADRWWSRVIADPIRRFAHAHAGLVGFIGLMIGAVFAHFLWKP